MNDEAVDPILFINGKRENEFAFIPAESLLSLFVLQCSKIANVSVILVEKSDTSTNYLFPLCLKDLTSFEFDSDQDCPPCIDYLKLPATYDKESNYYTAGLCSSLRCILNSKPSTTNYCERLLGFRGGCLQACAEVSVWTKFCELESIEMLNDVYVNRCRDNVHKLPVNVLRLEKHLERPPILHNALKRKQEVLAKTVKNRQEYFKLKQLKLDELPELEHKYVEGIDLSLADVLLFVCFDLVFYVYSNFELKNACPLTLNWHHQLSMEPFIKECTELLYLTKERHHPLENNLTLVLEIPSVPNESLYSNDPLRYKPRWRSYTKQSDIDEIMKKLNSLDLENSYTSCCKKLDDLTIKESINNTPECKDNINGFDHLNVCQLLTESKLNWEELPLAVHPIEGKLPASRLQRKCNQLESLVKIVISIAREGDIIVDFCAGGGHLGIILAFLLPQCQIIFVENKKESLDKAVKRVKTLKLKNVNFFQCNLDYFEIKFDIGTCLHACGVATDLVLKKCIEQNASFVCSPCCYGSIRPNSILDYPRSLKFKNDYKISLSEYLILGHAADQTHDENNPKTVQGKKCMQFIDHDRLMNAANSHSYFTKLLTMFPVNCTPKNHILLGLSPKYTSNMHHD